MILIYRLTISYIEQVIMVELELPRKSIENYWLSVDVSTDSRMSVSMAPIESRTMSFVDIIVEIELVWWSSFDGLLSDTDT